MAASQLHTFTFVSMNPPPPYPFEGLELESRAGVDGYAAWKTGIAADTFQVETLRDLASLAAAENQLLAYQAIIGSTVEIRYAGILRPYLVLVHKCEPVELRSIVRGVGGILGTSRAILRVKWQLTPWVQ